jgi:hypothetical protein
MMMQLSQFTIHGSSLTLEIHPHADSFLMNFRVSAEDKQILVNNLSNLGIRSATLFPDLDHLAEPGLASS